MAVPDVHLLRGLDRHRKDAEDDERIAESPRKRRSEQPAGSPAARRREIVIDGDRVAAAGVVVLTVVVIFVIQAGDSATRPSTPAVTTPTTPTGRHDTTRTTAAHPGSHAVGSRPPLPTASTPPSARAMTAASPAPGLRGRAAASRSIRSRSQALDALDAGQSRARRRAHRVGQDARRRVRDRAARSPTGGKAFYTTPLKALSNQKYGDFVRAHGARQRRAAHRRQRDQRRRADRGDDHRGAAQHDLRRRRPRSTACATSCSTRCTTSRTATAARCGRR